MHIFGLINKDSGPGFHRVMMPLLMMPGADVYITNNIKEEDFEERRPGIIFYSRVISDEILLLRNKYQCKLVLDVDDYWRLDPHHIAYETYMQNNLEALQIKHLHIADIVTTTHERLAEKIYPHNKNVVILPNAIPNHEYFEVEKTGSERLRLFWQGSITHEKDIEMLRYPIKRLDKNKYLAVMAGYTKHEVWDRMVAAYTNGLQLPGCILHGLPPQEYYGNYKYADVCLAPLLDTPFNSLKSNLKILEAAHAGVPVIASHVQPYINLPVLYAHKQTDWIKNIHELSDEKARAQIGQQLKAYCATHYNFDTINKKRKECFE